MWEQLDSNRATSGCEINSLKEMLLSENPYLTFEAYFFRIVRKMMNKVSLYELPEWNPSADLFQLFHDDIKKVYDSRKERLSLDEQNHVERILGRDAPHSSELVKFATIWMKHDPARTLKWFAVDGTLGLHPKYYVHEAFSSSFEKHATSVRNLYDRIHTPQKIKAVVEEAFARIDDPGSLALDDSPLSNYVHAYMSLAGLEEVKRMHAVRNVKRQTQPEKCVKRVKRKITRES